jgi:ABC-type Fe3+/spermidine/putrescine transport system ATPase subunit
MTVTETTSDARTTVSYGLDLEQIEHSYHSVSVLKGLSLSIAPGEFFCLLGPSGGGKTTLLNAIAGLITPTSGRVVLDGQDITAVPIQQRDIGIVFQSYALFPNMSVRNNVAYGLRVRRRPKAEIDARVDELLRLVRLDEKGHRYPKQLSGGEQQRVAVARALAVSPKLLLLDEPMSNLDAKLRDELGSELRRVQRETGVTTVLVTHDQDEAFALADRVGVIDGGALAQVGSPKDLYAEPGNLFVAGFIGESNRIDAEAIGAVAAGRVLVSLAGKEFRCRAAADVATGPVIVVIRPHKLRLDAPGRTAVREESVIPGTVRDVRFQGSYWRYEVDSELGPLVAHEPGSEGRFGIGDRVSLVWGEGDAVAFEGQS